MMGLEEIKRINRNATKEAKRRVKKPWVPTEADKRKLADGDLSVAHFPFLADYVPKGWKRGEDRFVDISGFGADDEPALSSRQLAQAIANDPPGLGYALTEHGQFQGYVTSYTRKGGEQ